MVDEAGTPPSKYLPNLGPAQNRNKQEENMAKNPLQVALKEWLAAYEKALQLPASRARYVLQLEMNSLERVLKSARGMQDNLSYIMDGTALSLFRLGVFSKIVVSAPLISMDAHGELNTYKTKVWFWKFTRTVRVVKF